MTEHTPRGGHAGGVPRGRRKRGQSCQDEGDRLKQNWQIKEAEMCKKEEEKKKRAAETRSTVQLVSASMRNNTTKKQQLAIKMEIPSAAMLHLFPFK